MTSFRASAVVGLLMHLCALQCHHCNVAKPQHDDTWTRHGTHSSRAAAATPAPSWSILDQVNVTTILETATSPMSINTGIVVAAVVSQAMPSAGGNGGGERQDAAVTFAQRLVILPTGQSGETAASFANVTSFCDTHGDCSTVAWCLYPANGDGGEGAKGERLRITFLSAGGGKVTRVWFSELEVTTAASASSSTPMPVWANSGSVSDTYDIMYYAATGDCATYAFTYGRTRPTSPVAREVREDVLIDVIGNAPTVVQNVLCTVAVPMTPGVTVATPDCLTTNDSVGMAAWLISCWSHPSQFAFQPLSASSAAGSKRTLAFTHTKNTRANDWADLDEPMGWSLLDVGTRKVTRGGFSIDDGRLRFQPTWSHSGERLAFVTLAEPSTAWLWSQVWNICFASADLPTMAYCDTVGSPDQEPNLIGFVLDDEYILYTEQHSTAVTLNMWSVDAKTHKELRVQHATEADPLAVLRVISAVSLPSGSPQSASYITLVGEALDSPPEVYFGELDAKTAVVTVRPLSNFNAAARAKPLNVHTDVIAWPSGNLSVEALLVSPASGAEGKPLVAFAHPGPNMAHAETYLGWGGVGARYPVATLAEMGYSVLLPNIRGSAGYGAKFRTSIYRDWGGEDLDDLLSGLVEVHKLFNTSTSSVHVFGWSYGGFLSAMALTHASERFPGLRLASVCIGGGIVDLISHTGTADIGKILSNTYGGYYWDTPATVADSNSAASSSASLMHLYQRSSAMFSIVNATAPTLLHHGAHDPRVPILQAFQLHYALQARGVETRMLVYPGSGHIPGDAEQLLSIWNSTIEWIVRHDTSDT
eukprot:scpid22147/ scgid14203/ Acylamino-acid-releasing enzyme; Acyl-peptide hydrolase; Acylaminoacyl-peptidase